MCHGPDCEPSGKSSVHAWRQGTGPFGHSNGLRNRPKTSCTALAELGVMVCSCSRLLVAMPSTPFDAKGLLVTALRIQTRSSYSSINCSIPRRSCPGKAVYYPFWPGRYQTTRCGRHHSCHGPNGEQVTRRRRAVGRRWSRCRGH